MIDLVQKQQPMPLSEAAPAWDKTIPPAMINIVSKISVDAPGVSSTGPVWNPTWLLGLEQFIRSIVRDELDRAGVE